MDVQPKILLVEDEPLLASILTSFLHESGFAVTGVYSAADAATVIINRGSAFDALVTDINLRSGSTAWTSRSCSRVRTPRRASSS